MLVHNLPSRPTTFVGRTDELIEINRLLADPACRVLTLAGQGGIGKTRLAFQAAADQTLFYPHGVYIVPLQSLTSADLIPSAIASALKIMFFGADEPHVQIMNYLREKHLLLVLDNFEHLLDGIDLLTELLAAAPDVKILVTSRERLNIQEEWTLSLDGLSFPNNRTGGSLENYSAIQLFLGRARQVQPTFSLNHNAESVKAICQQVEGMPLGIELAASWLRVMTCQQIAAQMTHSLAFQTTPLRNLPERHRSLRAVFEQSWNLLSDNEQAVLMRLSIFRGGFDLEAGEAVAGATLTVLARLADKSLIQLNSAGRYDLHELLRQYAADKLAEAGGTINTANQHLLYFMKLAEDGEAHAYVREQIIWYDRQEAEMDNLRAALAWSLSSEEIELGLRMAAALRWVWEIRGYLKEGTGWFEQLLMASEQMISPVRIKALHRACECAGNLSDTRANEWGQEALRLARSTNDKWNIAWALCACGMFTQISHSFDEAAVILEESVTLFRELDDPFGLSHALRRLAIIMIERRDADYAETLVEEALVAARKAGDKNATAWSLLFKGNILWRLYHQPELAIKAYEESSALFHAIGENHALPYPLSHLADIERLQGNLERSLTLGKEVLTLLLRTGLYEFGAVIQSVVGLGNVALAMRQPVRAGRLLGAAYIRLQTVPRLISDFTHPHDMPFGPAQLDNESFNKGWAEGLAMTWEQTLAYALSEEPLPTEMIIPSPDHRIAQPLIEPLSDREIEILRLMAQGLSNPQIAKQLVVATGTIKAHTNHIFGKLNVINRVQAVNRAKELHLL